MSGNPESRFRRVLVTGGAGFIGSHVTDALARRGCKVTVLDDLSSGTLRNIKPCLERGAARLVEGDVCDLRRMGEAFGGVEAVIHLAAIASVVYSIENPSRTNEVNAEGTRNVLEEATRNRVSRFVYVSSCAVYGDPQYLPIDENHPTKPMSPYAESKLKGEEYCKAYLGENGIETVILRLFNIFGPRQIPNEYSGVITKFVSHLAGGSPPVIYGDGKQTRDFTYVSDAVDALLLSMTNNDATGQIFNIGSGRPTTINELCRLVARRLGAKIDPVYEEPRSGEIRHSYAEIEKAKGILGYTPKVSLEKGLEDTIRQRTCNFE